MNYKRLQVSTIALALSISGQSFAGGYIGAGIGQTNIDVCGELISLGATSCDDEDTGFKFFGGYNINKNFAVEGAYVDAGEISASGPGGTATAEATAFTISGKGSLPLNEAFSVFGKLGIAFWDVDASATGLGSASDDGSDITFGVGAEYSINEQFSVRGDWDRVDADDVDVDLLSISAVFKF